MSGGAVPFGGPTSAEYPTGRLSTMALRTRGQSTMLDVELGNKDGRLAASIRSCGEQFRWCGELTRSAVGVAESSGLSCTTKEQVNQRAMRDPVHSRTQWFGECAAAVASHIIGASGRGTSCKPPREGHGERAGMTSTGRSTLQRERRWTTAVGARLAYLRPGRLHMRAEPE